MRRCYAILCADQTGYLARQYRYTHSKAQRGLTTTWINPGRAPCSASRTHMPAAVSGHLVGVCTHDLTRWDRPSAPVPWPAAPSPPLRCSCSASTAHNAQAAPVVEHSALVFECQQSRILPVQQCTADSHYHRHLQQPSRSLYVTGSMLLTGRWLSACPPLPHHPTLQVVAGPGATNLQIHPTVMEACATLQQV